MGKLKYLPEGYQAVIPALNMKGAAAAIKWYQDVFNAVEKYRLTNPDKTIAHAEIIIGGSVVMVSEENPQYNKSPKTLNGTSVNICLYVPDVDATMAKAAEKGAAIITPAADQFYGDRSGRLEDPYGYIWIVSTYKKHLSPVAMQKMMDEMMKQS